MKLNKTQTKILEALTASAVSMTAAELSAAVGVKAPTINNNTNKLFSHKLISYGESVGNTCTFGAGEFTNREKPEKKPEPGRVECQVCEGHYTEEKNGTLWNHGYKRPGFGWLVGGCYGVGYKPFPATNRLEIYLTAVEERQVIVADEIATADTWPTIDIQVRVDPRDCWNKKTKTVTLTRPTADDAAEIEAAYDKYSKLADGTEAADWKTKVGPAHKAWSKLDDRRERWERAHSTRLYHFKRESKELVAEVERVTKRITKGRELREAH